MIWIAALVLFLTFSLRPTSHRDWTWRQMRIRMRRVGLTACLIVGALVVIGAAVTGIREAGPPAVETA